MLHKLLLACSLLLSPTASAVDLNTGDLLVSTPGAILHIDPAVGDQSILTPLGSSMAGSTGVAVDTDRTLVVAVVAPNPDKIVRLDPVSGDTTVITTGGLLQDPVGIAVRKSDRMIFVANLYGDSVVKIDPTTGEQTLVSEGGNLRFPIAVVVSVGGDLLVASAGVASEPTSQNLVLMDSETGEQTVVWTGVSQEPISFAVGPSGQFYIAAEGETGGDQILLVVPGGEDQTIASLGNFFSNPLGMSADTETGFIFAVSGSQKKIIRIDPTTGEKIDISLEGYLQNAFAITLVPKPGETSGSLPAGSCGGEAWIFPLVVPAGFVAYRRLRRRRS